MVVEVRPSRTMPNRGSAHFSGKRPGIAATAALLAFSLTFRARAGVTPRIQREVHAATFEVVLRKPPHGPLTYQKPLPRELIPYQQRTDEYRQVGTAFALGANTYVTAGHVLEAAVDSQYGMPALRGADGKVYPIASIVKFSLAEDYAVFTLAGAPAPAHLAVNRNPRPGERVFAVGNALGEGIAIRGGLLTSETPEAQDGRWRWIRFSAAASPGDSGGPLLDALGRVIGIVIAKSPDENLNYALPVGIALDGPGQARFDKRYVIRTPFMQGYTVYTLKDDFALPLTWAAFEHAYQAVVERHFEQALRQYRAAYAGTLFPKGNGANAILYSTVRPEPAVSVVVQQANDEWTLDRPTFQSTYLPGNGKVSVASVADATLLRVVRSNAAYGDSFYSDSREFMNEALKGLVIRRRVGPVRDRITSLGPALSDVLWTDRYGRTWQQRVWPLPYLDSYLIALLLPTPDGYLGVLRYSPSEALHQSESRLKLLADQVNVVYQGTLAQWSAFLTHRTLLPAALAHVSLTATPDWTLRTPRFQMSVPAALVKLDDRSRLYLAMTYAAGKSRPSWQVAGAWWYHSGETKKYVGLWRQPRPPAEARRSLQYAYTDMQRRLSPFNGLPIRVAADEVTSTTVLQAPGSTPGTASGGVLYGLTIGVESEQSIAGIGGKQTLAMASMRILEHGTGASVPRLSPEPDLEARLNAALERWQRQVAALDRRAGKDLLGHSMSQDFDDYVFNPLREAIHSSVSRSRGAGSTPRNGMASVFLKLRNRSLALLHYWMAVPAMMHNRALWSSFLAHNHMAATTPHGHHVLAEVAELRHELAHGDPSPRWAKLALALTNAYVAERNRIAMARASKPSGRLRPRTTKCPPPAPRTSGHAIPAIAHTGSLFKYYPQSMQRAGIEGTVVLRIRVSATGCATAMAIGASSGSGQLDRAALRWEEVASYLPAERHGRAVSYTGDQPVTFSLNHLRRAQ